MALKDVQNSSGMRKVTVCAVCLTAACWQGVFMCDDSRNAGTVDLLVYQLRELDREHPSNWVRAG